ncbi:ankyrin repeat and PRANC domain-containing protein [Cotia virus SPAn232]|uniref:Ankyrin repeat and PRANC domain-containing protein n=2 Tax=Cotia virus TaxID=39444 RepID=H6TAF8_9POXV|nr:ankyrin repeat and PRANC domain-containing protein [Cotia virus SPAn232]YP_005296369.1 ankyrin repeat and PRANC domain-containing protein [Cotia virus SPAn232]AIT70620.1 ankyrin repeat and PRANC domain-containing protein [Cotia virus]AFB76895.1 ankyrin repeat and PRANC domain-containing protein [Cotia virus SPAn232]AFB76983.1 ankyrin repeat and PRANC domain-containing protein [Cotia virus SPAn232]AIT70796.1 ankyrin repeat and PRANC domain-containing protein [Cotia virus]
MYKYLKTNNINIIREELSKCTYHDNNLLLYYICHLNTFIDTLDKDIIKLLLDYGSNINNLDRYNETILQLYFYKNSNGKQSSEIIKLFIDAGVDLHVKDKLNGSILHTYFSTKYIELENIKILVENGVNVSDLDSNNKTVIHYYINRLDVNIEILKYLLDNVSDITPFKYISYYYLQKLTPNKDIIKILIDRFGISLIDDYHIIYHYIKNCHVPDPVIVKMFIDNNVCEDVDYYIYSALEQYINITKSISVKILIGFIKLTIGESDHYKKRLLSIYISKCKNIDYSVVKYLHNIIKTRDELEGYPLHDYGKSNIKIYKLIISNYNFNINDVNEDGLTLLQISIINSLPVKVINYLLSKGADINVIDNYNRNILDLCLYYRNLNVLKIILKSKPPMKIIFETINNSFYFDQYDELILKEFIYICVPIYKEDFINCIRPVVIKSEYILDIVKKCYYDICKMNKCILYKSIPMVDLINYNNTGTLTRYVNNYNLNQTVDNLTIYKNIFNRKINNANYRIYLLECAINYFGKIVDDCVIIPKEIKYKIFSYFNKKDLNLFLDIRFKNIIS